MTTDFWFRLDETGRCVGFHPFPAVPGLLVDAERLSERPRLPEVLPEPVIHQLQGLLNGAPADGRTVAVVLDGPRRTFDVRARPEGPFTLVEGWLRNVQPEFMTEAEQTTMQALLDTLGVGVAVSSPGGIIQLVNPQFCSQMGLSQAQLLGREANGELLRSAGAVGTEGPAGMLQEAVQTGERRCSQVELGAASGNRRFVQCCAEPVKGPDGRVRYVVCSQHDLTPLRDAQTELRREHGLLEQILDASPTTVCLVDETGRLTYVNPAGERLFRRPAADIVGRPHDDPSWVVQDLEGAPIPPQSRPVARALVDQQPVHGVEVVVFIDGERRIFSVDAAPLFGSEGRVEQVLLLLQDVTGRHENLATKARLRQQMDKLSRYESLAVLAGGVAHDFNNMLMGVMGAAALAQEHAVSEPVREQLRLIEKAGARGAELTRQLLAYAGRTSISVGRIDLAETVRASWKLMETLVRQGLRVTFDSPRQGVWVEADGAQVRQALLNLLINASQAIPDSGRISVRVGTTELDRTADLAEPGMFVGHDVADGTFGFVEVEDSGVGMSSETLARIFDPFFTTRPQQPGLGLAAVLGLAKAHRGWVRVHSELGRGTKIRLGLPTWKRSSDEGGVEDRRSEPWLPRKILVVEDEDMVAQFVVRALERKKVDVERARDGREGIELFDGHSNDLEAVMVDLTMPRVSGDRVLKHIRERRPELPVIVMSGYTPDKPVDPEGPTLFLQKPFRPAQMWNLLSELAPSA